MSIDAANAELLKARWPTDPRGLGSGSGGTPWSPPIDCPFMCTITFNHRVRLLEHLRIAHAVSAKTPVVAQVVDPEAETDRIWAAARRVAAEAVDAAATDDDVMSLIVNDM